MNLILVEAAEVDDRGRVEVGDERAHHIRKVLCKCVGDTVRMGVVGGGVGMAPILEAGVGRVVLLHEQQGPPPQPLMVDLILAMPRPKVMKRLWAQLAALGVDRIFITQARRVERYYFDSHALREDLIRRRLIEGLSQAGDTRLPGVTVHRHLRRFLGSDLCKPEPGEARFLLHPACEKFLSARTFTASISRVMVAVGPEGGWTEEEYDLFCGHGFIPRSLGTRILRSDTACVAALSAAHLLREKG